MNFIAVVACRTSSILQVFVFIYFTPPLTLYIYHIYKRLVGSFFCHWLRTSTSLFQREGERREKLNQMGQHSHSCCNKQKVKRGLWSPEEDEKLINYISSYGHGCWSSVPRLAGISIYLYIYISRSLSLSLSDRSPPFNYIYIVL